MLTMRRAQMDVFEDAAMRAFESRTFQHLQKYFPGHCHLLGEKQMCRAIRHGWEKSKSYGLTAECCARTYIEFMCLLGGGFDTDPLLPWAAEILNDKSQHDQVARGDRLYERAWEYIVRIVPDYRDPTGAPTTGRFVTELKQLRSAPDDPLPPAAMQPFAQALTKRLERVFPAKFHVVGAERVQALIVDGVRTAAGYGLVGTRGATIFITLKFVLGSGFDRDPLVPWAATTLNDDSFGDPRRKADRLYLKALSVLGRWWDFSHKPSG